MAPSLGSGSTPGGSWSVLPVGLNINSSTGNIDFNTSTPGVYTITYTTPGACTDTHTETITVVQQESAAFTLPVSICFDANTPNPQAILSGTPGGNWSISGGATISTSGEIDLSTLPNEGIYTVTYTTPNSICGAIQTEAITLSLQPNSGTATPAIACSDGTTAPIDLFAQLANADATGFWTETSSNISTGLAFNAGAGTFNPNGQASGIYTFDYTVNGNSPCTNATTQVTVTVTAAPYTYVQPNATVCHSNDGNTILNFNDFVVGDTGDWTDADNSGATGTWDAMDFTGVIPNQTYIFTFTTNTAVAPCSNQTYSIAIFVQDCSCPSIALVTPKNLCNDAGMLDLTTLLDISVTEPGTWAIVNTPGGSNPAKILPDGVSFDASNADAGNYEVQYTLDAPKPGCPDYNSTIITVHPAPDAGEDGNMAYCNDDLPVDLFALLGGSPMNGGSWQLDPSSPNKPDPGKIDYSKGTFNITGHSPGFYFFNYEVAANAPCIDDVSTVEVAIDALPTLQFVAGVPALCNTIAGGATLNLNTLIQSQTGLNGVWSDTDNASANGATINFPDINVNGCQPGVYTFTYTLQSLLGFCAAQNFTIDITVNDCTCPDLSLAIPPVVCNSLTTDLDALKITTQPGTWTLTSVPAGGTPGFLAPDGHTFDAIDAQVGNYVFTFTLLNTPPPGCPNFTTITINVVDFTISKWANTGAICANAAPIDLNNYLMPGSTPGGTWTINGNPLPLGILNPAALGAGTFTTTYAVGSAPCGTSFSNDLIIIPAASAAWTPPALVCAAAPAFNLNTLLDANATPGGSWLINGIPANILDPAAYLPGTIIVSYTVGTSPCIAVNTQNITIIAQPLANIIAPSALCIGDIAAINYGSTANAGAIFTWNFNGGLPANVSGPGPHNITWASGGQKTITLTVEDQGCISKIGTAIVQVDTPLPTPVINCQTNITDILFSWNAIPNASGYLVSIDGGAAQNNGLATSYTASGLSAGQNVSISVEAISNNTCPNSIATTNCIAQDCPPVTINIDPVADICLNASTPAFAVNAIVSGANGGGVLTWSGVGIIDATIGQFDPVLAGVGSHTLVCTYTENTCIFNKSITINIYATPTSEFTVSSNDFCADGSTTVQVVYTGSASVGANYTWGFDGATVISGNGQGPYELDFDLGSGIYTISLIVTENGCSSALTTSDINVSIPLATPVVNCNAVTTNSVEFIWSSIAGASGYIITYTINGGATITDNTSNITYLVSGLAVNDVVDLSVIAVGAAPCGNSAAGFGQCSAQDCPPITPNISIAQTVFCSTDAPATLNATPVGGSFAGTGVVGNIFNPKLAAAGTHTITYTYTDAGTGCPYSTTIDLTVNQTPNANFLLSTSNLCADGISLLTIDFIGTAGANAIFTWDFGGGTSISPPNGDQIVTYNQPEGTTTISLSITDNGCTSTTITADLNLDAPVATPVVNCGTATTDAVTFNWNNISGSEGYAVSYTVNNNPIVNDNTISNSYTISGLSVSDTIIINVIALNTGVCGNSASATATCYTLDCPLINPTITGLLLDYCVDAGIITPTLNPSGGSLTGNGVVTNQFNCNLAGVGLHTLTYTYIDPSTQCVYTTNFDVTVLPLPQTSFDLSANEICTTQTTTVTYTGTPLPTAVYTWNFDGATIISGSGFGPYELQWSSAGIKNISLSVTASGCSNTPSNATVNVQTPLATPVVNCGTATTGSVEFIWIGDPQAEGYQITLSGDVATQTLTIPDLNYTVSGLIPGNSVSITVIALSSGPCGNSLPGTATCVPLDCPPFTPTITLLQNEFCTTEAPTIVELSPVGGLLTGNGIANGNQFDTAMAGPGNHTLNYQYTDPVTQCNYSTSTTVTVWEQPNATLNWQDETICLGDEALLTLAGNMPATSIFTWNAGALGNLSGNEPQTITPEATGEFPISVEITNGTCKQSINTLLTVSAVTVQTIEDQKLLAKTPLELTTTGASALNGTLTWLWDDDFSEWIDATQLQNQSPTITPTDTNTVTLTVTLTDAFGCSATDEVTIQVFKNNAVIIPNAFSPNNDGINDIFAPVGFNIDKFDLEIYQRWGQLIHAQTGAAYGHGWDGKLPDGNRFADIGVYVYYLKVYYSNGKTATRSGNVTLVK